jgi:hypothetical protein
VIDYGNTDDERKPTMDNLTAERLIAALNDHTRALDNHSMAMQGHEIALDDHAAALEDL